VVVIAEAFGIDSIYIRVATCACKRGADGNGVCSADIGFYDTSVADKSLRVSLKMDRIDYWLSVGAQPSEKVNALIRKVKKGKFGVAAAPAPMQAPKAPEPEAPAEEAVAEGAEAAEATTEETAAAAE